MATFSSPRSQVVHVIEPRGTGALQRAREVWEYRGLVPYFGRRYVQKRYQRTHLGWLWLPLRPALTIVARALVFGGILGVATGRVPYFIFFLVASAGWQLFAEATYWATRSLELNRRLLAKVYVPRLVPLAAAAIAAVVEYLVLVGLWGAALLYYILRYDRIFVIVSIRTLLVPVGIVLLVLLGLGIGLWTSAYGMHKRDVRFMLTYVLSFWYVITPVIYPLSAVPHQYIPLVELNPVVAPIQMIKDGLLGSEGLTTSASLVTLAAVVVIWAGGLWLFGRAETTAIDAT